MTNEANMDTWVALQTPPHVVHRGVHLRERSHVGMNTPLPQRLTNSILHPSQG